MATRELTIEVRQEGGASILNLAGEVDSSAEAALQAGYERATAEGSGPVVLNFGEVDYINSSGIALIVGLLAQARSRSIEVRAYGLSDHYREIFEITRLSDFMTILDNETSAVSGADGKDNA